MEVLTIFSPTQIIPDISGLFISQGIGIHPKRKISGYELIVVRSGTLGIAEENRRFSIKEGQALLLWPNRLHKGIVSYAPDLSFYWIHFSLKHAKPSKKPWLRLEQRSDISEPNLLYELIHRFLDDQKNEKLSQQRGSLLIALMLLQLSENLNPRNKNAMASRAERYISMHFRDGLQTSQVAKALRCNRDYLSRVYQKTYGKTLTKTIHQFQINAACRLLCEDNKNIEEISLAVGFRDTRNFRRAFTSIKGMSPQAYRRHYASMYVNVR